MTLGLPAKTGNGRALIFGQGFGLYGHALAIQALGFEVLLPKRYHARINERADLAALLKAQFLTDAEIENLSELDLLCFARRPADNERDLKHWIAHGFEGAIVSEKPLSTSAEAARGLLEHTIAPWLVETWAKDRRFGTPFIFAHTDWCARMKEALASGQDLHLQWSHRLAFDSSSWKSNSQMGGGTLSFYAIHLLALLVHFKEIFRWPDQIVSSWNERQWQFSCGPCVATFSAQAISNFRLTAAGLPLFEAASPFGATPTAGEPDPRIAPLRAFYQETLESQDVAYTMAFQASVIDAWAEAQKVCTMAHG